MKKFKLFILALAFLTWFVTPVAAEENTISISGTQATTYNNFAIIDISIGGGEMTHVKGTVSYNPKELAVFSVEKNSDLKNWTVSFDTSKSGTISFEAKTTNDPISLETILFSIKFVVYNDTVKSTKVSVDEAFNITSYDEQYVVNQEEIDKVTHDKETAMNPDDYVVPDPIYGTRTVETPQAMAPVSFPIAISSSVSSNAYLKSVEFTGGKISPAFNKLTNTYQVTLAAQQELDVNAVAESSDSIVEISDEINEQVIITVKAADDTMNSYVFNIIRDGTIEPITPEKDSSTPDHMNKNTKLLLLGIGLASLALLGGGGYLVFKGSRVYDEEY